MTYHKAGHPDGKHTETVRDERGRVIGRVPVTSCLTPAEVRWYRSIVAAAGELAAAGTYRHTEPGEATP